MRCYSHPDADAVGICPQCGKAGCRDCLAEVDGTLLCARCAAARSSGPAAARGTPVEQVDADAAGRAQRRIRWSWRVALVVGSVGFVGYAAAMYLSWTGASRPSLPLMLLMSALGGLIWAYMSWAVYWGVPPLWRWAYRTVLRLGRAGKGTSVSLDLNALAVLLFALYLFVVWVPVLAGVVYGVLGGGVHQYLQHRRAARRPIPPARTESVAAAPLALQ